MDSKLVPIRNTMTNMNPTSGTVKQYQDLFRRWAEQPASEVLAHFGYRGIDGEDWETPYDRLAMMVMSEPWTFQSTPSSSSYRIQRLPILTNYLNYTFRRCQEQGRIARSGDGDYLCFNTGLQTPHERDVYAVFTKNSRPNAQDWFHIGWFDSYSTKLQPFGGELPKHPTYIDDPADVIYDPSFKIELNYDHIVEDNKERLPEVLQGNVKVARHTLNSAVDSIEGRLERNYKIAVPSWHKGHLTLMVPLYLTSDSAPDVVLTLDKDKESKVYRGRTILTLDMAYVNARLIIRPDSQWLTP